MLRSVTRRSSLMTALALVATTPAAAAVPPAAAELTHPELAHALASIRERWRALKLADNWRESEWDAMEAETFPLCEEIMRAEVRTFADLVLQAQAAALVNTEYWLEASTVDDIGNHDPSLAVRVLVDGICALAGVEPLPGVGHLVLPLPVVKEDADREPSFEEFAREYEAACAKVGSDRVERALSALANEA